MSRPEEVDAVRKALKYGRRWAIGWRSPGSGVSFPKALTALTALTDELERAKQAHEVLDAKLTQARSELAAKDRALREIAAGPYNGFEQCKAIAAAALSPSPPEQETNDDTQTS